MKRICLTILMVLAMAGVAWGQGGVTPSRSFAPFLKLGRQTPSSTTDTLYNPGGVLTYNGTALQGALTPGVDYTKFVTPEQYSAVGNGIADDTTPFNNMIAAALVTGAEIRLPAKTYLIAGQLVTPVSGGRHKPLKMIGTGADRTGTSNLPPPTGGTVLNMTYSSGPSFYIPGLGQGEISGIAFCDLSGGPSHYLIQSFSPISIHECTFQGTPGHLVNGIMLGDSAGTMFTGYGCAITNNFFQYVDVAGYLGMSANSTFWQGNIFGQGCGGTFTDVTGDTDGATNAITGISSTAGLLVNDFVTVSAGFATTGPLKVTEITSSTAIKVSANSNSAQSNVTTTKKSHAFVLDGYDAAHNCSNNTFVGNLVQTNNYTNAVFYLGNCARRNKIYGDDGWDGNIPLVHLQDDTCLNNEVIGGFRDGSPEPPLYTTTSNVTAVASSLLLSAQASTASNIPSPLTVQRLFTGLNGFDLYDGSGNRVLKNSGQKLITPGYAAGTYLVSGGTAAGTAQAGGVPMQFGHAAYGPTKVATRYFGANGIAAPTQANNTQCRVPVAVAHTIKTIVVQVYTENNLSTDAGAIYIEVNGSPTLVDANLQYSAVNEVKTYTGLAIPAAVGDYIDFKIITPNWVGTPPAYIIHTVTTWGN